MNQILATKLKRKTDTKIFEIQFILSSIISVILVVTIIYYIFSLTKKEKLSDSIINNYNISRLYANNTKDSQSKNINNLFGIIEIPKINIYYPVFSNITDELLKISPCKFYGGSLEDNGNICIAGHNYNNLMFFSNISKLKANDEIFIYDNLGRKYTYIVFNVYEVSESDLTPVLNYKPNTQELTLVTCNNLNSNRVIVKSKKS